MKRFVICLDGTWQKLRQDKLTNIGVIARSVAHSAPGPNGASIPQIVLYSQGVGSTIEALSDMSTLAKASSRLQQMAGGAFGEGLEDQIVDTYLRLAFNYEADDEIFIFGFSRGAYAARSLAGMINAAGIVSRRHAEQAWEAFALYRKRVTDPSDSAQKEVHAKELQTFRKLYGKGRRDAAGKRMQTDDVPNIQYLGIFDTVGQRGIPETFGALSRALNKKYGFHDLNIASNVQSARHAVAVDEDRLGFPPTLWENLEERNAASGQRRFEQCWFVGTHGDVGGGLGSPLSAPPLKWIADGAEAAGLKFYPTEESPLHEALREANADFCAPIARPSFLGGLSPMQYRLAQRRIWKDKSPPTREVAELLLHRSVAQRFVSKAVRPRYNPTPLQPFRKAIRDWVGDED